MIRYRRKDNDVEAVRLTPDTVDDIVEWCGGQKTEEIDPFDDTKRFVAVNVPGTFGMFRLSEGDWLIKDQLTGFAKCSNASFEAAYDPV